MGVITYFLLCGYTPFDRDTQQQEMEAIIAGDYKFEPGMRRLPFRPSEAHHIHIKQAWAISSPPCGGVLVGRAFLLGSALPARRGG